MGVKFVPMVLLAKIMTKGYVTGVYLISQRTIFAEVSKN